ncbi:MULTISPECIES: FecCD family ABC transporter permease [Agrobacterium tumefaciens complex]|jgi:iron complex transport system permease protein|uniref:Putative siderophore transport system permease protein YfiZ n=1 Tax=Agrobacterium tumefaciens str. Kerr 14 TaxID=1183424 RepID=A0A1S7S792_AGRTU|nr:iron ABC transporter permease [Agrobacterium tumefaciens]AYM84193.1 iron complex transport system permease protein [Agrobacterium tumefaciens]EHH06907.1 ABC transporter membrane spanning protein (iron(III) dicitrate) [Agrobacterium tumefaciens CCNWGS0286]NTE94424.1 iron ABC transporter permease [Agrobacterium tumefaciens]UXS27001.1 iron ABC transporter permease [Agrobacterium tumefaciens]UXS54500.1 iron ABC transporter permease [Agrobacterium tumefaciens]
MNRKLSGRFVGTDSGKALALAALLCLLAAASLLAVALGTVRIPLSTILDAIFRFDGSRNHLLVVAVRLPRVIAALLAGSALAVSGAIMQAITNNPLASPGLLGINAGAAFAVVSIMTFFGAGVGDIYIWFAFLGAGIAAFAVTLLSSFGPIRHSPVGLILAGAIVATFLTSLTSAVLIFDQSTLDAVRMWTAGSVTGRTMAQAATVAPYIAFGLIVSLFLGRHLTTLSLGADTARSVGQNTALWRGVAIVTVILLAGGAVALAGPIGFVGLIVPHIVRMAVSVDYRWIIPFSALGGALLVVGADMAGRMVFGSQNFPVGVTIALVGAPFFLWLARNRMRGET